VLKKRGKGKSTGPWDFSYSRRSLSKPLILGLFEKNRGKKEDGGKNPGFRLVMKGEKSLSQRLHRSGKSSPGVVEEYIFRRYKGESLRKEGGGRAPFYTSFTLLPWVIVNIAWCVVCGGEGGGRK